MTLGENSSNSSKEISNKDTKFKIADFARISKYIYLR